MFNTNLVYGPPDGPPKDSVPIDATTIVTNVDVDKKPFAFKITTDGEELILNCASEEERTSWVTAITNIVSPPPPANPSDNLGNELENLRIAKQKASEDESSRLRTEAIRREREAAEIAKKKAIEEAEARRIAEEKAHREALAAAEAAAEAAKLAAANAEKERQARIALITKLSVPVACNKKLSNESAYHPRFIWIKDDTKEFHWGKTADDFTNGKSKSIVLTQHMKSVKVNPENSTPNFSIELVDSDLPDSVYAKSVFNSSAASSIDITLDDAVLNNGFVSFLKSVKQ